MLQRSSCCVVSVFVCLKKQYLGYMYSTRCCVLYWNPAVPFWECSKRKTVACLYQNENFNSKIVNILKSVNRPLRKPKNRGINYCPEYKGEIMFAVLLIMIYCTPDHPRYVRNSLARKNEGNL